MSKRNTLLPVVSILARGSGGRLALGALLSTLVVMAGMALLGTSGWFITATALAGMAGAAAVFNVFLPSAAIRLLALGRTFGRYAERVVTHDATLAVLAALRERLFRGWAEPHAARALLRRPARLLFRLTNDIDALDSIYLRLLVPAIAACGAAMLGGAVLGLIDWRLGTAMFAWLLGVGWAGAAVIARRARPLALRRARALERLRAGVIDLVAGQTELAIAGRLRAQCEVLERQDTRLAHADDALHRLESRAGWAYAVAGHATVACVLLALGWLAQRRAVGAPAATLALLVALTALEPFAALRRGAIEAGRSWLAARRIGPRLTHAAALANAVPDSTDALCLDEVTVVHAGRERPALHDITLRIPAGEKVAVIGASGAGKSTLLALAAGELPTHGGRLRVLPCTWLTQRTELFQDSLRDNLLLADPRADDAQLWEALRDTGLAQDVERLAQGLDTPLGEGGLGLSGGQSRRLALARLLLRRAGFWLLDEPTEALDALTAADVLSCLARHAGGRTVLLATHLRREAALADRLLLMRAGRIVGDVRRGSDEFDAALATLRHY